MPRRASAQQAETSYVPAALKWNTTYFWKVNEVAADGSVVAGDVWSFKVADYIPVIDEAVTINYDNTADPFITELAQEYALRRTGRRTASPRCNCSSRATRRSSRSVAVRFP